MLSIKSTYLIKSEVIWSLVSFTGAAPLGVIRWDMAGTLTMGRSDAVFADLGCGFAGLSFKTAVLVGLLGVGVVGDGDLDLSEIVILGTVLLRFAFILLMLLFMMAMSAEKSLDFDALMTGVLEDVFLVVVVVLREGAGDNVLSGVLDGVRSFGGLPFVLDDEPDDLGESEKAASNLETAFSVITLLEFCLAGCSDFGFVGSDFGLADSTFGLADSAFGFADSAFGLAASVFILVGLAEFFIGLAVTVGFFFAA